MAVHQCEKWQLRESAKGGMYCAACGMAQDADLIAEEFTERTDAVKQAFQRLLGDETPAVIWGEPAPRAKGDQP